MEQQRTLVSLILVIGIIWSPAWAAESKPGDAVDRLFAAYRGASVEGMVSSYTADAVFEDVNQRHKFVGTEQLSQLMGTLAAMHIEMDLQEKRRVIDGNTVVVEYDYVGKLNGAALGQSIGKTGCPDLEYVMPTTSWYGIEDGKIAYQRDFIDWATYLELQQKMLAAGSEE